MQCRSRRGEIVHATPSRKARTRNPPMVAAAEIVAFAPEERTFIAPHCAVLVGSRDEFCETERLAIGVVFVVAVLVRDASVRSPCDFRAVARHHRAYVLLAIFARSDLPRVRRGPHDADRLFVCGLVNMTLGGPGLTVLA